MLFPTILNPHQAFGASVSITGVDVDKMSGELFGDCSRLECCGAVCDNRESVGADVSLEISDTSKDGMGEKEAEEISILGSPTSIDEC